MELASAVKPKKRSLLARKKVAIAGVVLFAAFGYLAFSSFAGSTPYYLTPSELKSKAILGEENVRLSGTVAPNFEFEVKTLTLKFEIVDDKARVPVVYVGPVPDSFKSGGEVVAEGKYGADGVFQAKNLLVKCPAKYEASD